MHIFFQLPATKIPLLELKQNSLHEVGDMRKVLRQYSQQPVLMFARTSNLELKP